MTVIVSTLSDYSIIETLLISSIHHGFNLLSLGPEFVLNGTDIIITRVVSHESTKQIERSKRAERKETQSRERTEKRKKKTPRQHQEPEPKNQKSPRHHNTTSGKEQPESPKIAGASATNHQGNDLARLRRR